MRDLGRSCRWWRVIGRNRHCLHEIGYFLAVSAGAAVARARREKAALIGGLRLEAERA